MPEPLPTPYDLVNALQQRGAGARQRLWRELREPVERLLDRISARHGQRRDRELLTVHALHAAETHLRTRPAAEYRDVGWEAFRAGVLLHLAKMASQPFGAPVGRSAGPGPLPEDDGYQSRTYFLPYERIADGWFGGDWFGGCRGGDGSLWVLLADTTGHGYSAYLVAAALPGVWRRVREQFDWRREPADLLLAMHDFLADCLPEGIYVECTLVRLGADGSLTVAPAGGTRLLLRRSGTRRPDLVRMRGTWLGLLPPSTEDQRSWRLGDGDELLLGTDGVFDHLLDLSPTPADLLADGPGGSLIEQVERLLNQALAAGPQKDDITMVLLRRQSGAGSVTLPFPGVRTRHEAGDVPV
jgi:hypothetical protein